MYDLDTLTRMNRKAEHAARLARQLPSIMTTDRLAQLKANPHSPGFQIPFIGSWRPRGYQLDRKLFIDISGFGVPGEPAMTLNQWTNAVVVGKAYALIQIGQFQALLGEFTPPKGAGPSICPSRDDAQPHRWEQGACVFCGETT